MTSTKSKLKSYSIKITPFPNDNWTRVEIFLRAYGRLPNKKGDDITQKTLDLFCKKWEAGKLKTVTVDLEKVYLGRSLAN